VGLTGANLGAEGNDLVTRADLEGSEQLNAGVGRNQSVVTAHECLQHVPFAAFELHGDWR